MKASLGFSGFFPITLEMKQMPHITSQNLLPHHALLVEDDPAFVCLMSRAVAQLGPDWKLHVCQTGSAAMDFLSTRRMPMGLALVDLGLPYVSGIEVIREARGRFPDLPIVVVSVISAESSVLAAIQAGARGYVLKDDTELSIAHAIDQILQGNYPISMSLAKYLFHLVGSPENTPHQAALAALSTKESEVLQQLSRGYSYEEAAHNLGVAKSTIQYHIRNLYAKLDVRSKTQAICKARTEGLL